MRRAPVTRLFQYVRSAPQLGTGTSSSSGSSRSRNFSSPVELLPRRRKGAGAAGSIAAITSVRPSSGNEASSWVHENLSAYLDRPAVSESAYRTSSAFILRELDDRFSFLRPDQVVVDLGCFSGGWSQVAVERTEASSSSSLVIGVDRVAMDPLSYHTFILGDVADDDTFRQILQVLGDRKADVLLSDMTPRNFGIKVDDHLSSMECGIHACKVMDKALRYGGWFILKVYYGAESQRLRVYLDSRFEVVRTVRPTSARDRFRETFYVCRGFIGRTPISWEVPSAGSFTNRYEGSDRWETSFKTKLAKKKEAMEQNKKGGVGMPPTLGNPKQGRNTAAGQATPEDMPQPITWRKNVDEDDPKDE